MPKSVKAARSRKTKPKNNMPIPRGIAFKRSARFSGKSLTKISVGESGKFSLHVGIKQPSKKVYPYQVQFREKSKYASASTQKKGAGWTKWGPWRCADPFSWVTGKTKTKKGKKHTVKRGSAKDVASWKRANVGVNKKGTWKSIAKLSDTIDDKYEQRVYQYRVRCYNASKNKAGSWKYGSITVKRAPHMVDETLIASAKGSLWLGANVTPNRGGKLYITELQTRENGKWTSNLRSKTFSHAWTRDTDRNADSKPKTRSGYTPVEVTIPISNLKRAMRPNQPVRIKGYYKAHDGSKTWLFSSSKLHKAKTSKWDGELDEFKMWVLDPSRGSFNGMDLHHAVYVAAFRDGESQNDLYTSVGATLNWRWHGSDHSVAPKVLNRKHYFSQQGQGMFMEAWFVAPPFGVEWWVTVTVRNNVNSESYHRSLSSRKFRQETDYFHLVEDKMHKDAWGGEDANASKTSKDGWRAGYMGFAGNAEMTFDTTKPSTIELPYGRGLPFAAFGSGEKNKITVSGDVLSDDYDGADMSSLPPNCRWYNADYVRNHQGMWYVLSPDGGRYKVAVTEVDATYKTRSTRGITVTAQEVE